MTGDGGGLGLEYGVLRLHPTTQEWFVRGAAYATQLKNALGDLALGVEHIGSTAVPGLLAKPIIDLAIGLASMDVLPDVKAGLAAMHWMYRGDAGENGGHLFMLERGPWIRIGHAHGVIYEGPQWNRYLQLRDHLRSSADARATYTAAKRALLEELGTEGIRAEYTARKTPVITALLASAPGL